MEAHNTRTKLLAAATLYANEVRHHESGAYDVQVLIVGEGGPGKNSQPMHLCPQSHVSASDDLCECSCVTQRPR